MWLKTEFGKLDRDEEKVNNFMTLTYATQRILINKPSSCEEIFEKWPFLFEREGLDNHFALLMTFSCSSRLSESIEQRTPLLFSFLRETSKSVLVRSSIQSLTLESERCGNMLAKNFGIISLLAAHFHEDETMLVRKYEVSN